MRVVERGGGFTEVRGGERVQWTLLRATVMSNGARLWEPASGGHLWLNMSVSPHTIVPFPISKAFHPPTAHSSQPPPGRRQHIPSLSIDEEEKCMIYLFKDSQNQNCWQLWCSHVLFSWLWKAIATFRAVCFSVSDVVQGKKKSNYVLSSYLVFDKGKMWDMLAYKSCSCLV